jgi:hypothetical protein
MISLGFVLSLVVGNVVWAGGSLKSTPPNTAMIDIAGNPVPVLAGGLYDRYRSNPPLSVIASEAPDIDLSWFKTLKKTKADMGFESYSPNFYYKNSRITAVYTADLNRLKELMPKEVLEKVRPVAVWPGRGVVALTAYFYKYCDNDSYYDLALSIVTTKPDSWNFGLFSLIGESMSKDLWGYVLKLPVNTELARVRGVVGYNLPKWLAPITFKEKDQAVVFELFDARTGKADITIQGKKLEKLSDSGAVVRTNFMNLDKQGRLTHGYSDSRSLGKASSSDKDAVTLTLTDGSLSTYMKSLKLGKLMKYEYEPDFQAALYAPEPVGKHVQ